MKRYFIVVSGKVQGVGFRFFIYQKCKFLNLTGWTRNLKDGNVEIQVQGSDYHLLEFIKKINLGNGFSKTDDISIKEIATNHEEKNFQIIY